MDLQSGAVKANRPTSIQTDAWITERAKVVATLLVLGCAVYHLNLSNSPGRYNAKTGQATIAINFNWTSRA